MSIRSPRPSLHGLSVLIVDDNPVVRLASQACAQALGLDALCADGGDAALRALAERRFDAVLMDLHMPGRDGFDTAAQIRALGIGGNDLPIVALSATAEGDDLARCRGAAMNACLEKPLDAELLKEVLERLCRPGAVRRDGAWTWLEPAKACAVGATADAAAAAPTPQTIRRQHGTRSSQAIDMTQDVCPKTATPARSALQRIERALAEQIVRQGPTDPLSRALMRAVARLPGDLAPSLSRSGR